MMGDLGPGFQDHVPYLHLADEIDTDIRDEQHIQGIIQGIAAEALENDPERDNEKEGQYRDEDEHIPDYPRGMVLGNRIRHAFIIGALFLRVSR
jgi:hypothetical protein